MIYLTKKEGKYTYQKLSKNFDELSSEQERQHP